MKRRNQKQLEIRVEKTSSRKAKARLYYELALFHDNNNREKTAIPYYKKAIVLCLDARTKAQALAWLASSLYKTNQSKEALKYLRLSQRMVEDKRLIKFLDRLEKRIHIKPPRTTDLASRIRLKG